jgi:cell division protein FtsI/penicillin-binding protein 2
MWKNRQRDDSQSHQIHVRRQFTFRLNVFFFCVFILFSVLIVRLAYIQFVEGKSLSAMESALANRTVLIPPIRGNIYDRNGYPIAYSTSTQSLYYRMEPGRTLENHLAIARKLADLFAKHGDYGESSSPTVADVLLAMDVGYDISGQKKSMFNLMYDPRRVKSGLTQTEIAFLMSHPDQFPGVEVVEESVRHYDASTIATQLVGYLKPFSVSSNQNANYLQFYKTKMKDYLLTEEVGFDGLEFLYQDVLRGKAGERKYPVNNRDQIIGPVTTMPPKKGNNIHLTVEKNVQLAAEQAIMDQLAYMKSEEAKQRKYPAMGSNSIAGYAVAIEVDTGNVVAMASMPDYDANVWSGGISSKVYNEIQPFYQNGTIKTVYPAVSDAKERAKYPSSLLPLGSTIKPLTVLVGLKEGLIEPGTFYYDTGILKYGRKNSATIRNSHRSANGNINASDAIRLSSNTFMAAMIGLKLYEKYGGESGGPVEIWDKYMKAFGLGVTTGSGLPIESAGVIDYLSPSRGSVQNAMVMGSFGQQARYTTLQLAQYTTMLANRGKRMKPNFVEKITNFEGNLVETVQPVVLNQIIMPTVYWETVTEGMAASTKNNVLSKWFGKLPFTVAAKTGTSQQDTAAGKIENAVFISFAPADKPKLAVAVVVPWGGYGAWGAAPVAAKIFKAYHDYVGMDGKPAIAEVVNNE